MALWKVLVLSNKQGELLSRLGCRAAEWVLVPAELPEAYFQ